MEDVICKFFLYQHTSWLRASLFHSKVNYGQVLKADQDEDEFPLQFACTNYSKSENPSNESNFFHWKPKIAKKFLP